MAQTIQRSFTAGEIAPALRSRADLIKYATGLARCENFFVRPQGGVYSRPGLRFIGEQGDHTRKGRLIPFSFSVEQTYALLFEHLTIRIIRNGAFIMSGGSPLEVVTPYTEDQLFRIGYTQSADVLTLTHLSHDPMNLNRLSDTNWTLTTIDYSPGLSPPVFAGSTVSNIQGILTTNPARVTSASHGFFTGNTVTITGVVGMTEVNNRSFKVTVINDNTYDLDDEDATGHTPYVSGGQAARANSATTIGSGFGDFVKSYTYVVTAVDADGDESLPSSPVTVDTVSLTQTGGVRLSWGAITGADHYRVYKDPSFGTGVYGWIGDTSTTQFDDFNIAPITSDAAPEDRQPFNGAGNKPSVTTYYQQRQLFANTLNEPQTVYGTQTGNFDSLRTSTPARDDDAITFTVNATQVNEIRHMIPMDSLVLLTSGGEWRLTEGQDRVLTPATIGVRPQSYNGSSYVPPVVINSTAVYVQEKGSRVRDLGYEFSSDAYTGNDLSVMSEHLFEGRQIIDMAYADEPHGILWCVRDDGVMLGLTYLREHQVWGWHQHTTDGEFESVVTISEDERDAVYAIIKRTVNGSDVRYVERLERREFQNAEDAFYVDSGLSYDGDPITTITGLDHLEGESLSVLADGNVVENQIVNNGSITLLSAASKIHAGLPYTCTMDTLDVDAQSGTETLKGKSVSVSELIVEVETSRGGWAGPIRDDGTALNQQEFKPRFVSDGYDVLRLKTFKMSVNLSPEWNLGGGIRIQQVQPLPLNILSVIPDVDIGGN